jgi:RNA polymerase sigma-70 factor (ECF subfamily)
VLTPDERSRLDAGDPAFFRALYHIHTPALLDYAQRLTRTTDDAQDVVQEAWLRAFAYRHKFTSGSFAKWIHTITHSVGVDYYRSDERRLRRHALLTLLRTVEAAGASATKAPGSGPVRDTHRTLIDAILCLTPRQRDAVVFHFLAERDASDTARAMGVTTATVRVLVHQAVRALRRRPWSQGDALRDYDEHR